MTLKAPKLHPTGRIWLPSEKWSSFLFVYFLKKKDIKKKAVVELGRCYFSLAVAEELPDVLEKIAAQSNQPSNVCTAHDVRQS